MNYQIPEPPKSPLTDMLAASMRIAQMPQPHNILEDTNEELRKMNETSQAIKERLESAENEIGDLKGQLKEMHDAHKYDLLKEIGCGVIGALVTVRLELIAKTFGLL